MHHYENSENGKLDWNELKRVLTTMGEVISAADLDILLTSLQGNEGSGKNGACSENMTSERLIDMLFQETK